MLATTMVLGMSMAAFAEDETSTSSTGTGAFEGHVEKKTIKVTLPTIPDGTYNYILDPELLIDGTTHAKYGTDVTFTGKTGVYFLSGEKAYTADSKKLKAINKSSEKVDVTVTASVAENANIVMSDTDEFDEGDTAAKLYLAVTDGTNTKAIGSSSASLTVEVEGKKDNFVVKYDNNQYSYAEKDSLTDADWNSTAEIYLKGACNTKGDWSASGLTGSNVTVTWSYAEHVDSYLSATTMTASSNRVTLNLPENVTLTKVELTHADGTGARTLANNNQYTLNGTALTVRSSDITAWLGLDPAYSKLVLTFSDGKSETITCQQ